MAPLTALTLVIPVSFDDTHTQPGTIQRMDSESLGMYVRDGMIGVATKLIELKPYVEELWRRMDQGEVILECRNKKEFCERVLRRTPRAVRYMLAGGNPGNDHRREMISPTPGPSALEPPAEPQPEPSSALELFPSQPPVEYDPNFLSKEEADALFEMAKALPHTRPPNKMSGGNSLLRRLQMPCYSASPNFRGSMMSRNEQTNKWITPISDAPPEVKSLEKRLSDFAGKPVNYFSFVGYENERDHITWHRHAEDGCRDARVFIISLGEVRTFGVRPVCPACTLCDDCYETCDTAEKRACKDERCNAAKKNRKTCKVCRDKSRWTTLQPTHGSLVTLSSEANRTHEHALLDDKEPKGLRISINTKHIPPEHIPAYTETPVEEPENPTNAHGAAVTSLVHCQKEKYDVYIGRKMFGYGLPESPFANATRGGPEVYEPYFKNKLIQDPTFLEAVLSCHGKILGCWCKDTSGKDFSKCHGHVVARWAAKIFAKYEELQKDMVALREWVQKAAQPATSGSHTSDLRSWFATKYEAFTLQQAEQGRYDLIVLNITPEQVRAIGEILAEPDDVETTEGATSESTK